MFRLRELYLWNGEEVAPPYKFTDSAFVYGSNSKGKTALAETIDYVLGRSEDLKHDGLDNITHISALVSNGNAMLWIKRSVHDGIGYYYKRTRNSSYSEVSNDEYRDLIGELITDKYDKNKVDVYREVFGENPSFRSFAFLNFIDENNQGDLLSIFTRGKEQKYYFRIPDVMQFFFNFDNVEKLYEEEKHLHDLQERLKKAKSKVEEYDYFNDIISDAFRRLHLQYKPDLDKNKKTFKDFCNNFNRSEKSDDGKNDIVYLTKVSFDLSDEIKRYNFLKSQTVLAKNRKKHSEQLLDGLRSIALRNPDYKPYVDVITGQIKEIQSENALLSFSDYDASIEKIKKEKEAIDKELEKLKSQAEISDYESTIKDIALIEDTFSRINPNINLNSEEVISKQIKEAKNRIKVLKSNFDQNRLKKFNAVLTEIYLDDSVKDIDYVHQDMDKPGFSLEFNPMKQQINARRTYTEDENEPERYFPGSMARCNHIQMIFYLTMLGYLMKNFTDMRILPLLVIDSADQPIKKENFDIFYPYLRSYAESLGIQLIFISKERPAMIKNEDLIDISEGLNPFHRVDNINTKK